MMLVRHRLSFLAPRIVRFLAVCTLGWAGQATAQNQPQSLPTVQLTAGIHAIKAMVAQAPEERQKGLMHRRTMGVNEGMLFVFETAAVQCFWMRNTPLPLSAAFIGDDGRVVNIEDMKPETDDSHCSKKPVRYVLEMNQGWFARHGVKAGDKLGGATFNKAAPR